MFNWAKLFWLRQNGAAEVPNALKWERRIQDMYREQQTDPTHGQLLTDEEYRKALKATKLNKLGIGRYRVVYVSARYDH